MEGVRSMFSFMDRKWYSSSIVSVNSNGTANEAVGQSATAVGREDAINKAQEALTKDLAAIDIGSKSRNARYNIPDPEEMRKVFERFDENKDGVICTDELGRFMKRFGFDTSDEEMKSLMKIIDENCDGSVDFDEFYSLYSSLSGSDTSEDSSDPAEDHDESLKDAFSVFDKNGDGHITVQELQEVLVNLGLLEGNSLLKCHQMIQSVDVDGDGKVNFAEFKEMMSSNILQSS